jgi:glycosidase
MHTGDFVLLTERPKDVLVYLRQVPEQTILVALNFKNRMTSFESVPDGKWNTLFPKNREVVSTNPLQLAPYEVLILEFA